MTDPTTQAPQPTRRTRSAGSNQPEVETEHIEQLAIAAAQAGESLIESCPYPFNSDAGQHFCAIFYLSKNPASAMHNGLTKRIRPQPHPSNQLPASPPKPRPKPRQRTPPSQPPSTPQS